MPITQETQAAGVANTILALVAGVNSLAAQINAMSAQWANLGVANMLNAFPTAALNTDGTLGTVDATPNNAHPINIGVAPGSDINRAVSATDLASMLTLLQGISSCIAGNAVSANGAAVQLIAKAI